MSNTSREEWLNQRRAGIGGSDIGVLMGLNPYKTPYQLWMDKTGRSQDDEAGEPAYWGNVLEEVVAKEYAKRTGLKVQRVNGILQGAAHPVALANIDRAVTIVSRRDDGRLMNHRAHWKDGRLQGAERLLECKTAHALAAGRDEWGEAGTDQVPPSYWAQCQWYMGITGVHTTDLAVLFGGQKFFIYTIEFAKDLFDQMLKDAIAWWERHVVADIPPDPQSGDECRQRWNKSLAGKATEISREALRAIEDIKRLKAELKDIDSAIDLSEKILLAEMCDSDTATFGGQIVATWRNNKPSLKTDWKAVVDELRLIDEAAVATAIEENTETKLGARVLRLK